MEDQQVREDLWTWAENNLPKLKELARRAGGDRPTSVVNSFLARLIGKPTNQLRKIKNRFGYAARGIRNVIVNRFRKRKKDPLQAPSAFDPADQHESREVQGEDEQRRVFRRAWSELKVEERYIIEAHALRGESSEKIGVSLGITGAAVRQRKENILLKLREGIRLLWAAMENRWEPSTLHYRVLCLRHFQGAGIEAMAEQLGWTRRHAQKWLDRTRAQLPSDLKGLL